MWQIVDCKNGTSSHEVAKAIGVTQKSAYELPLPRKRKFSSADLRNLESRDKTMGPFPAPNVPRTWKLNEGFQRIERGTAETRSEVDKHGKNAGRKHEQTLAELQPNLQQPGKECLEPT